MKSLLKTGILNKSFNTILTRYLCCSNIYKAYNLNARNVSHSEKLSSKRTRELFLKYFVEDKKHTYVHSSPVFLNNDPTLLFVNAGMNQFRALLLNKTGHPFQDLKKVANSQKCVRLSGKHNDLSEVGVDLYHHTFFEMLGNWSFGDYRKLDSCKMAWELLTNIYGLDPQSLYVTYFGGDELLGIPSDEECKSNWIEIGVHPNHIFPFGATDNFWEMGDIGPCGPCSEIHYDFNGSGHEVVAKKINTGSPDVMEIWNLVFIQYNREKDSVLTKLPILNIDTGMGLERLCAVLQGTNSNYDTDIFIPLFQAIQSNFKVRPYSGKTGVDDTDGLDTAYRILADHSRMFSVAIADGLFPDNWDAGHVLRKIIRRAAYAANRIMKAKPGVLSSIVPYVAETLDFFPEVDKHTEEIISIINDEEKMFHQVINKGRKARNRMISTNPAKILDGNKVWELHQIHGLEMNVVQDLASEISLAVDWQDYENVKKAKQHDLKKQHEEKTNVITTIAKRLRNLNISICDDSFKYRYTTDKKEYGVADLNARIVAIFKNASLVSDVKKGDNCILITDKSNFYSEAGGQVSSIGKIYSKDFTFNVKHVSSAEGYVYHHGVVEEGQMRCLSDVQMNVDMEHHLACSQHHTATHILNSALRKVLPYTAQRSSYVGPTHLRFAFSAKSSLTSDQLEEIESFSNEVIQKKMKVSRDKMMFEELLNHPNVIFLSGEDYPDSVSVITIEDTSNAEKISIEPCCGTHVHNTSDIESFVIIPTKSSPGSTKIIAAVTGKQASIIKENGKSFLKKVEDLEHRVNESLTEIVSADSCQLLLKEVKKTLGESQSKNDVPLLDLKKCENVLKDLKLKLTDIVKVSSDSGVNLDSSIDKGKEQKCLSKFVTHLKANDIMITNDVFKYDYFNKEVKPITAKILAIFNDDENVSCIERGLRCILVLDKTNFYSEEDDQASDEGTMSCEDFTINVNNVYKSDEYVFHDGIVSEGTAVSSRVVRLSVDQEHRLACSQNHTALHMLNAVMKAELPYYFPLTAKAESDQLLLNFTAKGRITDDQLRNIECKMNEYILADLSVDKAEVPLKCVNDFPPYKASLIMVVKEHVPIITIVDKNGANLPKSTEPCLGTHVTSTKDIGSFIIITQKSVKDKERIISAVTGKKAECVQKEGELYEESLLKLEEHVVTCLEKPNLDALELWDCLKEVKIAKNYHETELPLLLFRKHQNTLTDLTQKLTKTTHSFVQEGFAKVKSEMQELLRESSGENFIVHELSSVGDGKKIANYAIENSGNKPALYFVKDGHKSVICSCSVPKSFVNTDFSALLWINPVATFLEGHSRTLAKDPELYYSIVSDRLDKVEEAIHIATEFALSHMDKN